MAFPGSSQKSLAADVFQSLPLTQSETGLQPSSPSTTRAVSLVFVDSAVADASSLLSHSSNNTEIFYLNAVEDAVTQITRTLLGYQGIQSLHIVSHGESGSLKFANGSLSGENLDQYTNQIKSWAQALSTDADILLYGCDVAGGVAGNAFIRQLGRLTQADITASTNLTGAGGDWVLEASTGTIESTLISTETGRAQYRYSLNPQLLSNSNSALASDAVGGDLGDRSVSSDGNFIVFSSVASNLDTGDTNDKRDIFLFNKSAGTITLVSRASGGSQPGNGDSSNASISADGNFVVFTSTSNNLTSDGKTGNSADIFRWNRSTGAIELISKKGSAIGNADSSNAVISADGSTIAFISSASNLATDLAGVDLVDNNTKPDAFVWKNGTLKTVSLDQSNALPVISSGGVGGAIDLSADGRFIVFNTVSQLISLVDRQVRNDVYLYDLDQDALEVVSFGVNGEAAGASTNVMPKVSFSGNKLRILFSSNSRLTSEDTNASSEDIYVAEKDFANPNSSLFIRLVSRITNGSSTATSGNGVSSNAVLSGNGRYVAFVSTSDNLVTGDTNAVQDVFLHDLDAANPDSATRLISRNGGASALGNGISGSRLSISDDGNIVAFSSAATNLVNGNPANDTNNGEDLFAYNRTADSLTLITRKDGATTTATIPPLGQFQQRSINIITNGSSNSVIYSNDATDLVARDTNGISDIFSFDLTTPKNTLITKLQGNQASVTGIGNSNIAPLGSVSRDGRYVVYVSDVNSLVVGDNNAAKDVFLRDTTLPATDPNALKLVSRVTAGSGNDASIQPFISANGQYIVFTSAATNLVTGDSNQQQDIFLYEVATGSLSLVSRTATALGDGASSSASVAVDAAGEVYVAFLSRSGNLGAAGGGVGVNRNNVFVWKKSTGVVTLVSKSAPTAGGNQDSSTPIISADGKFIAFTSGASNLISANFTGVDNNNATDVFLYDIAANELNLVSQRNGVIGDSFSFNPVISDTNGVVAFESRASNLTPIADTNTLSDIFRYSKATGLSLVSVNAAGNAAGNAVVSGATGASISADGNTIAFTSDSSDLTTTTDTNNKTDVFVRNVTTNTTTLISRSATTPTTASNGDSSNAVLSADGQLVGFTSSATDLSSDDTTTSRDVFIASTTTPAARLISTGTPAVGSNANAGTIALSADGSVAVFDTVAGNLIANDLNSASDVFSRPTRPTVSFKVLDATASEGATDTGTFEIKRTDSSGQLQVKLKLSDLVPLTDATASDVTFTADQGAIVSVVGGIVTVTLPNGVDTVILTLTAVADTLTEGSENAILTLEPDGTYTIDPVQKTGTVVIAPSGTVVTNTNDSGVGSLRQAIANALLTPGADVITFALTNPAQKTINLLTPLAALTGNITIDGGTSGIILNGSGAGAGTNGLTLTGNNNTIKGITVTGFTGNGIQIEGDDNTIGGLLATDGNQINANKLGVYVKSGNGNQILGNAITNNTDLGIDLEPIGITTANPLVLTTAVPTATGATINGTLTAAPGTYRIEFFSNATTDAVGRTEGEVYLGFQEVTIAAGNTSAPVVYNSTATGLVGKYISATITNTTTKTTSEFVKDIRVIPPLPIVELLTAEPVGGVNEGNSGTTDYRFTIKLSEPVTANTTFSYRTVQQTGATAALSGVDYEAVTNGSVQVLAGQDSAVITIKLKGDTRFEADKIFGVELFGIDSAVYASGTILATGTIKNDDARPTISFESPTFSGLEGQTTNGQVSFKINLSNESDEAVSVTYQTIDGTGTTGAISTGAGKDFTAIPSTVLTFNPGETTKTVNVELIADTDDEPPQTFSLQLSAPSNGSFTSGSTLTAQGIIAPDESPYVVSVTADNPTVIEGASGTTKIVKFTVTLDRIPQEDLTVEYTTLNDTAVSGRDFVNNGGTLTFLKDGPRTQTIDVVVNGNDAFDGDRSFDLQLYPTASSRAVIDATRGKATTLIKDDDLPTISFKVGSTGDIRRVEGAAGTQTTAEVIVELSEVNNTQDVTVEFTTEDGTGANRATVADRDYNSRSGKITIRRGQKSGTASFEIVGDDRIEEDEIFLVRLSNPIGATLAGSATQEVIIEDDDRLISNQPKISITAANATQLEGAAGTTKLYTFNVTLDRDPQAGKPVSVTVSTVDGTGVNGAKVANNDFVANTQVFTFNPGDALTKTFTVQVNGDDNIEGTETFGVSLTGPTNATLLTANAIGTIQDDDTPVGSRPVISISPATISQLEGNSGTTAYTFTVALDRAPATGETVTVDVGTIDGTGTTGAISTGTTADFTAKTQTLTFTPTGGLSQIFTVLVNGDTARESDEIFTVALSNAQGGTLSPTTLATATIQDDDTPIVVLPRISVTPVTPQNEGNSGTTAYTFRITLDKAPLAGQDVTVDVRTIDGVGSTGASSTGGNADFTANNQTVTFTATGALTQDFTVFVNGDRQIESNESFSIQLSNAIGATIVTNSVNAVILNDDNPISGGSGLISQDSLNDILWQDPVTGETLLWQTNLGPVTRANIIPNDYDPATWRYSGTADFNRDNSPDVLWHNIQTGEVVIWKIDNNAITAIISPTFNRLGNISVPGAWHIEDISDYTADNQVDILWRNYQTNQVAIWSMNGFDYADVPLFSQPISLDWKVEAIADFTGSGRKSLFWRNQRSGATGVWNLNDGSSPNQLELSAIDLQVNVDSTWKVVGTADLNGDRTADVLWQNTASGEAAVWYMGPTGLIKGEFLPKPTSGFTIKGGADFNLDGVADLFLQNTRTGQNQIWYLQQASTGIAYGSTVLLPNTVAGHQYLGMSRVANSSIPQLVWRNTLTRDLVYWKIDRSPSTASTPIAPLSDPDVKVLWTGDLDNTGKAVVLTRNQRNGIIELGNLNNGLYTKTSNFLPLDQSWVYRGIADFDADGIKDIVWQNLETGKVEIWKMGGSGYASVLAPEVIPGADWVINQVADFDGDGQGDLFWRNSRTDQTAVWLMNGSMIKDAALMTVVPKEWQVAQVKDFDRDGTSDLLWRNNRTGAVATWLMDGKSLKRGIVLPTVADQAWVIKSTDDYDRDGNTDILWYNSQTKQMVFWNMKDGNLQSGTLLSNVPSSSWDLVGTRDFNGDGNLDLLWLDTATGTPTIWYLNGNKFGAAVTLPNLPTPNFKVIGLDDFNQISA